MKSKHTRYLAAMPSLLVVSCALALSSCGGGSGPQPNPQPEPGWQQIWGDPDASGLQPAALREDSSGGLLLSSFFRKSGAGFENYGALIQQRGAQGELAWSRRLIAAWAEGGGQRIGLLSAAQACPDGSVIFGLEPALIKLGPGGELLWEASGHNAGDQLQYGEQEISLASHLNLADGGAVFCSWDWSSNLSNSTLLPDTERINASCAVARVGADGALRWSRALGIRESGMLNNGDRWLRVDGLLLPVLAQSADRIYVCAYAEQPEDAAGWPLGTPDGIALFCFNLDGELLWQQLWDSGAAELGQIYKRSSVNASLVSALNACCDAAGNLYLACPIDAEGSSLPDTALASFTPLGDLRWQSRIGQSSELVPADLQYAGGRLMLQLRTMDLPPAQFAPDNYLPGIPINNNGAGTGADGGNGATGGTGTGTGAGSGNGVVTGVASAAAAQLARSSSLVHSSSANSIGRTTLLLEFSTDGAAARFLVRDENSRAYAGDLRLLADGSYLLALLRPGLPLAPASLSVSQSPWPLGALNGSRADSQFEVMIFDGYLENNPALFALEDAPGSSDADLLESEADNYLALQTVSAP